MKLGAAKPIDLAGASSGGGRFCAGTFCAPGSKHFSCIVAEVSNHAGQRTVKCIDVKLVVNTFMKKYFRKR
jgi:hypothetical protein